MARPKHFHDQGAGPTVKDADHETGSVPDGLPVAEDAAESEGEQQAREAERGVDHALNRTTSD